MGYSATHRERDEHLRPSGARPLRYGTSVKAWSRSVVPWRMVNMHEHVDATP